MHSPLDLLRSAAETTLDTVLHGGWAARLAARAGLQPRVSVQTLRLPLPASVATARPLRLVFLSDFHAGPTTDRDVIADACAQAAALAPDVLLLGGDFVSFHHRYAAALAAQIAQIAAPLGRFAVLGNHDYWAGAATVIAALERAGVTLLTNMSQPLPAPYAGLWVVGLDDVQAGRPDAATAFAAAGPERIVLMHSPAALELVGARPYRLALAGHTHGGQVCARDGRTIKVVGGPWGRRYPGGIYFDGPGPIVVSRGVGCSTGPVRYNAAPDVTLCVFEPPG